MSQGDATTSGPLAGYRVLDLTDEKGQVCAWVLAFLGADVIKVEPPGGSSARWRGPFYHDEVHPEKSLFWFSYNSNKRGITLNVETADGRELLKRLARDADFLVESFDPGYMDSLGLGYQSLSHINPRLVMVSITHFGQSGPYRDYKGSDIVHWALSSAMYVSGDPDRPPVRVTIPQAYLQAGTQAAVGALLALHYAQRTGQGQHVDQSIQESILYVAHNHAQHWEMTRTLQKRHGGRAMALSGFKSIFPCKDGYVCFTFSFGRRRGVQTLADWMAEEGMADLVKTINWADLTAQEAALLDPEVHQRLEAEVERFFMTHTKNELYEGAIRRGLIMYPASTPQDLYELEQLEYRKYFQQVEHPELGESFSYPGAFAVLSDTPLTIRSRAPLIGEHNEEVYCEELGLSKTELQALRGARVI